MFDLSCFIREKVTRRTDSMFEADVRENRDEILEKTEKKTVLVIGGAGSIGSSFIKSMLSYRPSVLVVVDTNENALAELTRDLRSSSDIWMPDEYIPYPMDYASPVFEKMFRNRGGFDIVANFSAHKHVRSEKDIYSVEVLLRNNVLHARKLLDLLSEYPPEEYFCVSTDKAANPVNIMGASKRIMEDVIFSYSDRFPVKTARFANVAFSNGSLPAGFLSRIAKLQPISAPSDVRRYFVSPEESGQICMLSCMLAENREIFFPKLKEEQMTRFDTIAIDLLQENGYEVEQCASEREAVEKAKDLVKGSKKYPVFFSSSDTTGEKEYEEFYTELEQVDGRRFQSLGVIIDKEIPDREKLKEFLDSLEDAFLSSSVSKGEIVSILHTYLPEFYHIEKEKSLDAKM